MKKSIPMTDLKYFIFLNTYLTDITSSDIIITTSDVVITTADKIVAPGCSCVSDDGTDWKGGK